MAKVSRVHVDLRDIRRVSLTDYVETKLLTFIFSVPDEVALMCH